MKNDTPIKAQEEMKTFTQEEVTKMLEEQKVELREKTVAALGEKNKQIQQKETDLLTAGSDSFYDYSKWEVMKKMATDMVASNALPTSDNAYTIMMKMQAGREMGLKPIESIKSFYIVKGVLNIFGDAVIRRLREHGWSILPYKEDAGFCTASIRKGDEEFSETFTYAEAEKSGWTKVNSNLKPGWVEGINRRRKLRYGAMSTLIKTYVPEVLGAAADIAEVAEDTIPLYQEAKVATMKVIDDRTPATEQQKENIKKLIKYDTLPEDEAKFADEWIDVLSFNEAGAKMVELAKVNKEKK